MRIRTSRTGAANKVPKKKAAGEPAAEFLKISD
jgi:hypothetical protein